MHILKGVTSRFPSQVPNIFQTYFAVRETLLLSFDDVVFLKGAFLAILLSLLFIKRDLGFVV